MFKILEVLFGKPNFNTKLLSRLKMNIESAPELELQGEELENILNYLDKNSTPQNIIALDDVVTKLGLKGEELGKTLRDLGYYCNPEKITALGRVATKLGLEGEELGKTLRILGAGSNEGNIIALGEVAPELGLKGEELRKTLTYLGNYSTPEKIIALGEVAKKLVLEGEELGKTLRYLGEHSTEGDIFSLGEAAPELPLEGKERGKVLRAFSNICRPLTKEFIQDVVENYVNFRAATPKSDSAEYNPKLFQVAYLCTEGVSLASDEGIKINLCSQTKQPVAAAATPATEQKIPQARGASNK